MSSMVASIDAAPPEDHRHSSYCCSNRCFGGMGQRCRHCDVVDQKLASGMVAGTCIITRPSFITLLCSYSTNTLLPDKKFPPSRHTTPPQFARTSAQHEQIKALLGDSVLAEEIGALVHPPIGYSTILGMRKDQNFGATETPRLTMERPALKEVRLPAHH